MAVERNEKKYILGSDLGLFCVCKVSALVEAACQGLCSKQADKSIVLRIVLIDRPNHSARKTMRRQIGPLICKGLLVVIRDPLISIENVIFDRGYRIVEGLNVSGNGVSCLVGGTVDNITHSDWFMETISAEKG